MLTYRQTDIADKLFRASEDVERSLGYTRIYCGTSTATGLLERDGWQFVEPVRCWDDELSVVEKKDVI